MTFNKISPVEICKQTRKAASEALLTVIKQVWQRPFSEKKLKDLWLRELRKNKSLFPQGWYSPPPDGITVLIANKTNPQRLDYKSLRTKENWPQKNIFFKFEEGLIFVYASHVDKESGIFGDFGLTLYAGKESEIIDHLKKVYQINHQIVALVKPGIKVKHLYQQANRIFQKAGLINKVFSTTDPAGVDIGHSVPGTIRPYSKEELKVFQGKDWSKACQIISKKRIFINQKKDYVLKSGDCFTLEPSLIDPQRPNLPRVLFHTIIIIKENGCEIMENFKEIFHATGMDYML